MKISKLHIDQFRHLENLDFDFTYQTGERKGQPLDKICFIGQSATGKTGLLELINSALDAFFDLRIINDQEIVDMGVFVPYKIELDFEADSIKYKQKESSIEINNKKFTFFNKSYSGGSYDVIDFKNKIYHITSDILSKQNLKFFEEETILLTERYKSLKEKLKDNLYTRLTFNDKVEEAIWVSLLEENINYLQNFLQFATELINSGSVLDNSSQKKVDDWKSKNNNPLVDFSAKFNLILNKIQLEVDTTNTKNIIPLKNTITGESVSIKNISTGTKQLLLTALPLFKLNTKDSIILIDEPERSLYPDMQMDLMDHYQNLAPDAQFIVATHSPFIAASFQPEERFILYFNEEGKVAVRRGTSPIGDDPNDMLKNDFGVNYYNKFGEEAYKKYLNLKEDLAKEQDPIKKKELLLETVKLGDTYNF